MKETILMLGGGLLAGIIIMYLKNFILKKFKKEIPKLIPEEEKTKLLDLYNKGLVTLSHLKSLGIEVEKKIEGEIEAFSGKKLTTGMLKVNNGVLWCKDIASIFNLRKFIIIAVIIGCIYGWGWYQGHTGKPVQFNLDYDKEITLKLDGQILHKPKNSSQLEVRDEKGNIIKVISAKDIPELYKKIRPYGLILEPVGVLGAGISNANESFEGGIGLRYAKFFKWFADVCLTTKGFYPIGVSYKLTDNSAVGLSVGTGYQRMERGFFERFLLKYSWKF